VVWLGETLKRQPQRRKGWRLTAGVRRSFHDGGRTGQTRQSAQREETS
jgi:hypothetical protein